MKLEERHLERHLLKEIRFGYKRIMGIGELCAIYQ